MQSSGPEISCLILFPYRMSHILTSATKMTWLAEGKGLSCRSKQQALISPQVAVDQPSKREFQGPLQ